jgi:uncharacterized protein (TIGR02646 family)
LIRVTRTKKPAVLASKADLWLSELKAAMADPVTTKHQLSKAVNSYRHRQVKNALIAMFHGKCAYCESKITVVTYGYIEHFRPKSIYPELTFEWNNLLLSCDICNDTGHKGNRFPLDTNGNPLLLDPTDGVTDPNVHLAFSWDSVTQLASVYGRDERGRTVEAVFDLNGIRGRRELIVHRSNYFKKLHVLLEFSKQTGDPEAVADFCSGTFCRISCFTTALNSVKVAASLRRDSFMSNRLCRSRCHLNPGVRGMTKCPSLSGYPVER